MVRPGSAVAIGLELYHSLDTAFARAVVSEVHPFADGNGRIARIMMNAELVAAGEERIVIPTIYRSNYLSALKALSKMEYARAIYAAALKAADAGDLAPL